MGASQKAEKEERPPIQTQIVTNLKSILMGSSKMDSSAVYALFEELKQKIYELSKNEIPDNQTDSTFDIDRFITLIEELKVKLNQPQFSKRQIENLGQIAAYSIDRVNENFSKAVAELKAAINPIDEKINQIRSQQNVVIRNKHVFTIDFRNSKAALTMISMGLIILLSFVGNLWLLGRTNQLRDNDLKYRYIKSTNGISSENFYRLENIFEYHRDKKLIKEIHEKVNNWEKSVQETAGKVEREKMQNSQSKSDLQ